MRLWQVGLSREHTLVPVVLDSIQARQSDPPFQDALQRRWNEWGRNNQRQHRMSQLPEFETENALAAFVDTHDTAPYGDEMAPVDTAVFRLKRRRQTAVRVPMSQSTLMITLRSYMSGKCPLHLS